MPNQQHEVTPEAAIIAPPRDEETPEQKEARLTEARAQHERQFKQYKFNQYLAARPQPDFIHPVTWSQLILHKFAKVRQQPEVKHLNDDQFVFGVGNNLITLPYSDISLINGQYHEDTPVNLSQSFGGHRLQWNQVMQRGQKMLNAKQREQAFSIEVTEEELARQVMAVKNHARFQPLTSQPGIVDQYGRMNPELYFHGLRLVAEADQRRAQELADDLGPGGLPHISAAFEDDMAELAMKQEREGVLAEEPTAEQASPPAEK